MTTPREISIIDREIADTEELKKSVADTLKALRAERKEAKRLEREITTAAIEKLRKAARSGDADAVGIIARYADDDAADPVTDHAATAWNDGGDQ